MDAVLSEMRSKQQQQQQQQQNESDVHSRKN